MKAIEKVNNIDEQNKRHNVYVNLSFIKKGRFNFQKFLQKKGKLRIFSSIWNLSQLLVNAEAFDKGFVSLLVSVSIKINDKAIEFLGPLKTYFSKNKNYYFI